MYFDARNARWHIPCASANSYVGGLPVVATTSPYLPRIMGALVDLSSTTGSYLIGVFFELWLFGFTSLQSWYYFQHYPKDALKWKILVVFIWTLECLHAALSCHAAYYWLVTNYGNPVALNNSVWSADAALAVAVRNGVLVFTTHCFFCYRVWIVGGRRVIIPGIILVLALGAWGLDWAVLTLSVKEKTFSGFGSDIQHTSTASLVMKVATDTTIAFSLGFLLHKNKSGITRTDHLANKLIFWAINIGVLTSIADVLVLVFSEATSNLIFLAIYTIVGNLYSNSLLATLNIREYARTQVLREDGTSLPLTTIKFSDKVAVGAGGSTTMFPAESRGTLSELPEPTFRKASFIKETEGITDAV
ncbi:hypothetical protein OH77DRAFT_1427013 [Trametes cingulata]|nr:hypothetical protein OH77DRAFT_1427013 [Trametes cingulata]